MLRRTLTLRGCCTPARACSDTVDQRLKPLFWVGFGMYLAAFLLFWVPDQLFCATVRPWNLHAWFHVLSALSTYWFVVYIVQR